MTWSRRSFIATLAATIALPATLRSGRPLRAAAQPGRARRFIVFYFPDGVPGPSQSGEPSLWHCRGGTHDFTMPPLLAPLGRHREHLVFLNGLSMGPTDSGSHPGGAKKLLTGVDGGQGESVDRYLARTVGAGAPFRHLYLGAMANHNGASGDKHISYVGAGQTAPPEDSPLIAFERLFGMAAPASSGAPRATGPGDLRRSVIDGAMAELEAFRARLDPIERGRMALHLEALREVERRVHAEPIAPPDRGGLDCGAPTIALAGVEASRLYDAERFPAILRAQIDLMVTAMACGLTRVGVLQGSHHTSELIMSRFPGSEMYDPGFDMRSHQASHYGASHDPSHRELRDFVAQRRWWLGELAYLLDQLAARPEDGGTMLDHSLVLACTEVCDGNTHLHDDMPFVLAGGAGGALSGGRLIDTGHTRHNALLTSITHMLGVPTTSFGQTSDGPIFGLHA